MANTAIYQNLLQAPKSIADYDNEAAVAEQHKLSAMQARQNMLLTGQKMDEYTRARTAESELRSLYAGVPQGATQEQVAQHLLSSRTPQGIAAGQAMLKELGAAKKVKAETGNQESLAGLHKAHADKSVQDRALAAKDAHLQTSTSVTTPEQSIAWAERAKDHGWPADEARDLAVMFKGMPDGGLKLLPMLREQAVKIGDRARITGEMDRTVATNVAAGERSAGNNATSLKVAGIGAASSAASRAQAERHFQENMNTPQYMMTDAGLVAVPKKLTAGQSPTGTPVLSSADGQPITKPLKDIPATVNKAIIQNSQSSKQLDRAITLLEGKDIGDASAGGMTGDSAATGLKGYAPQVILNRLDPKGVATRAEIADVGSLKIHDRSGAAVTVGEAPRLMPFIPSATDSKDTAMKKLKRLRLEIANESAALSETYSKEQGYKPSPILGSGPKAGAKIRFDANGNQVN